MLGYLENITPAIENELIKHDMYECQEGAKMTSF